MLKAPQEDGVTSTPLQQPKKHPLHQASSWVSSGLQRIKEQIRSDWEYACERHSTALTIVPFALDGIAIAYAPVLALEAMHEVEQRYKMECYYNVPEESVVPNVACIIPSFFGAPTHEDYEEKLSKEVAIENADRISGLQKDCKDAVGQWITEPQISIGSRIECEDSNGDGVPEAVHYDGLGEDVSYSIQTGEALPRR